MQLTQHTDFGLRLLIVLARSESQAMPLPAFAAEQGISYNHVAKVAQHLVRAGFVTSQRGRNGGVTLARPPNELTVGEVVRALEPGMRLCSLRLWPTEVILSSVPQMTAVGTRPSGSRRSKWSSVANAG